MSGEKQQKTVWAVARKELAAYFTSPVAFIFLGTFLAVSIFVFFWVERFFERNIADVRPLFEWMPILLIFLVAALTMRMWSEERRAGTLEFLLTVPVRTGGLVFGKFLACMGLVAVALLLTLGVPISVAFVGQLDAGPVIGAYLASLLLAGAYCSVGLFISSRTDNQIVSLILTIVACFVLYIIGAPAFASLFGNTGMELLQLLGTGSRFESITRGIIDLRDLYYYISIMGVFLTLNAFYLDRLKWSEHSNEASHRQLRLLTVLWIVNFVAANFWLYNATALRIDLTRGRQYTISSATREVISNLQEPLLIRGYFSAKTHDALAPLVPQLRDLVKEYAVIGKGRIKAEFIDPRDHQDLEEEANQKFNIKPVPLQVTDRYNISVINSYFNILVQYGDKFEVLGFRDLIDLRSGSKGELEVLLRNPEYDLTRAIKKVLQSFQTTDNFFAILAKPVKFIGYFSGAAKLPEQLQKLEAEARSVLDEFKQDADGKFEYEIQDPDADGGKIGEQILKDYGFRPMASLLNPTSFYFYMVIMGADKVVQVPFPENPTKEGIRQSVSAALKRFAAGFLKTIGVVAPVAPVNPYMQMNGARFEFIKDKLREDHNLKDLDLSNGSVPEDVDLLLLLAPDSLNERQMFAVDQFLMKGGTVVLATAAFTSERTQRSIDLKPRNSGLEDWLKNYGVEIEKKVVLDTQNEQYPVPVRRNLGVLSVEEIQLVTYPPFVDVRGSGLNSENGITSGISQVTLNWPSPLLIDREKNKARKVTELLRSSDESWVNEKLTAIPDFKAYELGFPKTGAAEPHLLAAVVEGEFQSFFKGKDSPLLKKEEKKEPEGKDQESAKKEEKFEVSGVIEKSPDSARLIIFASNDFVEDKTLQVSSLGSNTRYLNSLQLIENAADWSLEDRALLGIRSRGHFSKTMDPLTDNEKRGFEYLNYLLLLLGLAGVYGVYRVRCRRQHEYFKALLGA